MIFCDLRQLQEDRFRTHVRNVMLVATLPYRLMQERRCNQGWQSFGGRTKDPQ
jgi:hypothetical protein